MVSDLNLTLKTAPHQVAVWATDLKTGEPVSNLTLNVYEMYQGQRGTLTTDAQGYAQVDLAANYAGFVVYSETPFAAASSDWARGISPWDFGVSEGAAGQTHRVHIYTDRAIYRPVNLHLKGRLAQRARCGLQLARAGRIRVTVRTSPDRNSTPKTFRLTSWAPLRRNWTYLRARASANTSSAPSTPKL